jgi:hypothetical protein
MVFFKRPSKYLKEKALVGRKSHNMQHAVTILKGLSNKWDGEAWTGLLWLRTGTARGACDCGKKYLDSIKCQEFLD